MEIKELWKSIPEYTDIEVSSLGRVKKYNTKDKEWKIVQKFAKDRDGYYKCNVHKVEGSTTQQYVHRLIALAFIENPDNKPVVNHIDGNRNNNKVDNLEWVTYRENVLHSYQYGNRKRCKDVPRNTLLTDYQIEQIDNLRQYYTVNQISKLYNIQYQSLKNIIHKRNRYKRLDDQQPSNYKSIYN